MGRRAARRAKTRGFAPAEWHLRAVVGQSSFLAYLLPDPEHSAAARSLLVVGYVVATLGWLRASRRARQAPSGSFARWWFLGAILLFALAINKQFNFRAYFEHAFRELAIAGNWYDRREPAQFVLAVVLPVVLAILVGVFLATKGRVFARSHRLALMGWLLLLLYQALRQTQEWKPIVPWLEQVRYHDWRLALELAGILLVALSAFIAHPPGPSAKPSNTVDSK